MNKTKLQKQKQNKTKYILEQQRRKGFKIMVFKELLVEFRKKNA